METVVGRDQELALGPGGTGPDFIVGNANANRLEGGQSPDTILAPTASPATT